MGEAIKTAVVIGGLGVIGRNLIAHLETLPDWKAIGLSRRAPDHATASQYISVDLLDAADCKAKLASLRDVTHIFYCAFQARPTWAEHNAPNLAMLANAVEALEGPQLQRVVLVQGTKIYGSHLGPFKTPAKESDPPHMLPNFYFDQQQWLEQQQQRQNRSWSWTALRPHAVCGFSVGSPMNLVTLIAVYAAISKELGLPLRFPGKPGAYSAVFQVVDADHLARAMVWSALAPGAANEAFNVTNGDFFRWCNLWQRIAELFEMPAGPVQTIRLTEFMADKAPLWESLQRRHGLQPIGYHDLVAWPFGDYVFGCDWDIMSDTSKIRRAGFHECVDSEEMMLRLLADFRTRKIVP